MFILLLAACVRDGEAGEFGRLTSPDGRIEVSIRFPLAGSAERPHWSASFRRKVILSECGLGLETADAGDVLVGAQVVRERRRSVDERIPVLFGKSKSARDRFREIRYTLETRRHANVDLVFRCYNDAIALRYELPRTTQKSAQVTITEELTSFRLEGEPMAFVQYLKNYRTSHEHNVTSVRYQDIREGALLDLPITFSWEDRTYAAITEAALRHYAGMSLMRTTNNEAKPALVSRLTPRPDGTKVVGQLPMKTPWRVVLIADRPGALLESETIYCLNERSTGDVSWIKPGKITFPWWNGDVYDGRPGVPILSFEMAKKYIDFCASNGIPTHSMTSTERTVTPWYHQSKPGVEPGPDTDVTLPRAGFDLASIRQYADSRKVRLWTWVHQGALRGRVEEAFAAFEKLGWSGMMVDFFDHDDQDSVEFAESVLEAAFRHHIMIHFHGIWKPTGLERTYPNLMNHEGALNLEYLKWSNLCTPEHNLMMAYTRLIAGPMDYHLGGFRAVPRDQFKPRNVAPNVLGTRCHHLAMYVCFDNPNPMVADFPVAYEGQPGFDFLKVVPTWWDETRVLDGEVGEFLITARRKGKAWYVGGMSARRPRELLLPLSFVGKGRFNVRIWKDAPDTEENPNHLMVETLSASSADTLKLQLARDGGFVAKIIPVAK
jgi:alpha-glucosidase